MRRTKPGVRRDDACVGRSGSAAYHQSDIPEDMEKIVLKAMSKEQSLRYASAEDMSVTSMRCCRTAQSRPAPEPTQVMEGRAVRERAAEGRRPRPTRRIKQKTNQKGRTNSRLQRGVKADGGLQLRRRSF